VYQQQNILSFQSNHFSSSIFSSATNNLNYKATLACVNILLASLIVIRFGRGFLMLLGVQVRSVYSTLRRYHLLLAKRTNCVFSMCVHPGYAKMKYFHCEYIFITINPQVQASTFLTSTSTCAPFSKLPCPSSATTPSTICVPSTSKSTCTPNPGGGAILLKM
jgi:hypothetical protein